MVEIKKINITESARKVLLRLIEILYRKNKKRD